jgi:hypothetical protein
MTRFMTRKGLSRPDLEAPLRVGIDSLVHCTRMLIWNSLVADKVQEEGRQVIKWDGLLQVRLP